MEITENLKYFYTQTSKPFFSPKCPEEVIKEKIPGGDGRWVANAID